MVQQAQQHELSEIMALIRAIAKDLQAKGINQWHEEYPTIAMISQDIEEGDVYVLKKEAIIIGVVTLNEKQDPEYVDINWLNPTGKTLVVHRLGVLPKHQGQGIGQQLITFAEQLAIQQQYVSIRFDTYSKNPRSIHFYECRGYQRLGQIRLPLCDEFVYCYEKILK